IAGTGALTALIAALIALTQQDLKRVLAYSTVSQLGYMFMALGAAVGGLEAATVAVTAGMFHLLTHAFFKALLFLAAGSVMHAMVQRLAAVDARNALDVFMRCGGFGRSADLRRILEQGRYSGVGADGGRALSARRLLQPDLFHRRVYGAADGVLYLPSLLQDI